MIPPTDFKYCGDELNLFERAKNWKQYFAQFLRPYVVGDVAEVGAGVGGTTGALCNAGVKTWLCIEPDADQAAVLVEKIRAGTLPSICRTLVGRLDNEPGTQFDTIIYIDVIEHIENDKRELANAFRRLRMGGHLVVLVPAFQMLYSEFDRHVGHFRRYSVSQLISIGPAGANLKKAHYLDSAGFALSFANRLILNSRLPTVAQISFWDRRIISLSRYTDKILSRWIGRSAVAIWCRD